MKSLQKYYARLIFFLLLRAWQHSENIFGSRLTHFIIIIMHVIAVTNGVTDCRVCIKVCSTTSTLSGRRLFDVIAAPRKLNNLSHPVTNPTQTQHRRPDPRHFPSTTRTCYCSVLKAIHPHTRRRARQTRTNKSWRRTKTRTRSVYIRRHRTRTPSGKLALAAKLNTLSYLSSPVSVTCLGNTSFYQINNLQACFSSSLPLPSIKILHLLRCKFARSVKYYKKII